MGIGPTWERMGKVLRIIGKVWGKLKTWNKKKDLNMKVWTS
jgi:hypothetical protein